MKLIRCKLCEEIITDDDYTLIQEPGHLKEEYHNDCWEIAFLEFWQAEATFDLTSVNR